MQGAVRAAFWEKDSGPGSRYFFCVSKTRVWPRDGTLIV